MEHGGVGLKTVFVVTSNRDHARLDRAHLREFDPENLIEFTGGAEVLESWEFYHPDLALLDTELDDMDGVGLLQLLRRSGRSRNTPVVMVTAENNKNRVLDAIGAGCSGYILRPYSGETYRRHVLRALSIERDLEIETLQLKEAGDLVREGNCQGALEVFEEIFSEENQVGGYFDLGMKYLLEQRYGQAVMAFKKAVKLNDLYAEAYKGMAEAYKGVGDMERHRSALQKAAEVYAVIDSHEECRDLFIEILKYDAKTPNPYNTLGVALRKRGDLGGALHAYGRALDLTPMDENIHFNMAKAFSFLGDRESALDRLRRALRLNAKFPEGRALYEKLAGSPWPAPFDVSGEDASEEDGAYAAAAEGEKAASLKDV